MSRQTYPRYKPSGVEWLGDVPEHWESRRLKYLVAEPLKYGANEAAESDNPDWPRYIRITDVDENGRLRDETFKSIPEDVARPYLLEDGDLLLARSGATVGKSFYYKQSWGRAAYAGYLIRARFNSAKSIPRFVDYFTNSQQYWQWLNSSFIQATIQNVNAEKYANLIVPVPMTDEQRDIAAFLDHETVRIDALIEKKERQIELLKEKRSALISHAVTKGLNPNAKMKDSGIPWLGKIPVNWTIHRAKVLFCEINERSITGTEELLTVSHKTGITRRSEKEVTMFMAETLEGYKKCKAGDLVINTMWAWMGALGVSPVDGIVSPSYNVYRLRSNQFDPWFYDYLFRTGRFISKIICHSRGVWTSRLRLYPEEFFEIRLPIPPLQEQKDIIAHIEKATGQYAALEEKISNSITLLREYRSALISAAVTGKIDVREEVA